MTEPCDRDDAPHTGAPVLNLFAKTPVAGKVKTRLIPRVGAEKAAQIAEKFILYTLERTTSEWPGERVLWLWPDTHHPLVTRVRTRYSIDIRTQAPGNLGVKMMAALEHGLQRNHPSAVMGCDLLHTPSSVLAEAGRRMQQGDNVFGRSEDGGFWLLGLNQSAPSLFDGIDWQAGGTGLATAQRAASAGVHFDYQALTMFDIDRPEDLDRLLRQFPTIRDYLSLDD